MKQEERFGSFLRDLRNEKGLSQQQLAELLFVSRKAVGNWELGNRMPDISMLSRLADCLDVDSCVLLDALRQPAEPPGILVVEDVPVLLSSLVSTMRKELPTAEVRGFRTGAEALEHARASRVSVAFLDIELPGENGIDLARQLQAMNARINIIYLTCHPEYVWDALETHCSGFLLKPLTPEKLHREIENLRFPVRGLQA